MKKFLLPFAALLMAFAGYAQTNLYGSKSFTWSTTNAWAIATGQEGVTGFLATWSNSSPYDIANLETTAGTVTVSTNESAAGIITTKSKFVITGSGTITLQGSTPPITMQTTFEIDAPISAAGQVQLTGTTPVLNIGTIAGTGNSSNSFAGGMRIPSTMSGFTLDGNINQAFGSGSNAGPIVVDGPGTVITNVGSMTGGTGNTIANAIYLNSTGIPAASYGGIAIGGTKPGGGGAFVLNYADSIVEGGSGASNVDLGGGIATGAGGSNGKGAMLLSSNRNNWKGKTIVNLNSTGYCGCGVKNCLPLTTQFVYGDGNTGSSATYGLFDLNGYNQQAGSIETNLGTGAGSTFLGITNTSASMDTLTIGGGGTSNTNASFGAIIGANTVAVGTTNYTGTNNIAVQLVSGAGTLTLTAANTYTGATIVKGGSLFVNGSLASGSAVSVSSGGTIGGTGTAAGTLALSGTVSPGSANDSVGNFTTGTETWSNGAVYQCNIATGTSSGLITTSGSVTFPASGTITLNVNGSLFSGFSATSGNYTWQIFNAGNLVNFNAANISINPSGFSGSPGASSFSITNTGGVVYLHFTSPGFAISPSSLSPFSTVSGTPSAIQSYIISGTSLSGAAITVSAPNTNFEVSLDSINFHPTVSPTYTGSTLNATKIYVRISASAGYGALSAGTGVSNAGAGATTQYVTISGNGLYPVPTGQATNVQFSNVSYNSFTVNWSNGGGTSRLVIVRPSSLTNRLPADGTNYTADTAIALAGTTGTSNYVVFNGAGGGPITITGLTGATGYTVEVYEYNGTTSSENYDTTTNSTNPNSQATLAPVYYWNGHAASGTLAKGGNGTWNSGTTWISPTNNGTGSSVAWTDGNPAVLVDTPATSGAAAGTILIPGTVNPTSTEVQNSGYVLSPTTASATATVGGNLILDNNVNLNLFDTVTPQTGTLLVDFTGTSFAGTGTASLIVNEGVTQTGITNYSELTFTGAGTQTVSVPVVLNGPTGGYVGVTNTGSGTLNLSGGVQIAGTNSAVCMIGGTSPGVMSVNGITAPGSNLSPVEITNHPKGSGNPTFTFTGTSNYYGPTYLATNTTNILVCGSANCLSPNSVLNFGATTGGSNLQGPILDIHGSNQTIAGLANTTSPTSTGSITNSVAGLDTLTINQVVTTTFALDINKGAGDIVLYKKGTGNLILSGLNTYTGGLKINTGLVTLGATDALAKTLPVDLNGGGLSTGVSSGFSDTVGTLNFGANSSINLGTLSHTLLFSGVGNWPGSDTLTINNWAGTPGASGTAGKVIIDSVLSQAKLGRITFAGYAGAMQIAGTNEVVPVGYAPIYSVKSGVADTGAIWSLSPTGSGNTIAALGGFKPTTILIIQSYNIVTAITDNDVEFGSLTIQHGATFTSSGGSLVDMIAYGNITVNGTLGSGSSTLLAIDMEGSNDTISGTGTMNIYRIRKNYNTNATTNLIINRNINFWANGAAGMYNAYAGTATFNVTVSSGVILNFEGLADLSIDGTSGTSSTARAGVITIAGTITGVDTVFAIAVTSTSGNTGIVVENGGTLSAQSYILGLTYFYLNVNTGGNLIVNSYMGLVSGTFAPVGTVTFTSSSASQVAILDNFSSGMGGNLSGTVKAQRTLDASSTSNQHFMGSPLGGVTLSQFGASGTSGPVIPTSNCDETHLAGNSPWGTVFTYNENNPLVTTDNCGMAVWTVVSPGTAVVTGLGYSVTTQGGGTLTLTGTPNLASSYKVDGLTNSNWSNTSLQNRPMSSGWQMVSNPYQANLSISDVQTTNPDFSNEIAVWNTEGPNKDHYTTVSVTSGSPAIIPPFQGFLVHKTTTGDGPQSLTMASPGFTRVLTPVQFYSANANELNITATNSNTGLTDNVKVAFNINATDSFDPQFDVMKFPAALTTHTIYTLNNGMWMSWNILHSIEQTNTVPLNFEPGVSGSYTLAFDGVNTFDPTSYLYLEDTKTGTMQDMRSGSYSFTAEASDDWNRFVLHFTPATVINTIDGNCTAPGTITIQQPGTSLWSYMLSDVNNVTLSSGSLSQFSPVIVNANAGSYTLTLTGPDSNVVVKMIQVNGVQPITAAFDLSSATVQQSQNITLAAAVPNAVSYQWSFGNGNSATGQNVVFDYKTPGVYTVVLTVSDQDGCSSSASKNITVTGSTATGLADLNGGKGINIWSNENNLYVDFTNVSDVNAVIKIYDILGQELSSEKVTGSTIYSKQIRQVDAAYLLVMVKNNDEITTRKVFIANDK